MHQSLVFGGELPNLIGIVRACLGSSSASTQSAVPGPETPEPILTRRSALITAAGCQRPGGRVARSWPTTPTRCSGPQGEERRAGCHPRYGLWPASTAARAASSSSIGTTMPGSTTRSVRNSTGSRVVESNSPSKRVDRKLSVIDSRHLSAGFFPANRCSLTAKGVLLAPVLGEHSSPGRSSHHPSRGVRVDRRGQAVSAGSDSGLWLFVWMRSAACSVIMTVGAWVWPRMRRGMIEASMTCSPSSRVP